MNFIIKSTKISKKIEQLCPHLIQAKLFHSYEWQLYPYLQYPNTNVLVLAYAELEGVLVGVSILTNNYMIMTYVLPKYRKKGIGSALVKKIIKRKTCSHIYCGEGIRGSLIFYKKLNKKQERILGC